MKRSWQWLKFAALGLTAIVAIGLIVLAVANARAKARLEARLTELRAAGEPLSLPELARKPIPPETNAATYLRRAKSDVEAIDAEVTDAENAVEKADDEAFEAGRPGPAILAAIRAALAAYPQAVPLLVQASQCPQYNPPLDFTVDAEKFLDEFLPQQQQPRAACRVLRYRTLALLADGQREEALQMCLAIFRLSRQFDQNPLIISYLVSLALRGQAIELTNRVLRSGPLPAAAYDELEAELAQHDLSKPYRESLRSDRAYGTQRFREMAEGPMGAGYRWLPLLRNDQSDYLELFDFAMANGTRPYSDQAVQQRFDRATREAGVLTSLIVPALTAQRDATARVQAEIRCLRVLNALTRREQAGQTDEPTLSELGLPADVILDPYTGDPLHLQKTPEGWLVYSQGANLKDDGGKLTDRVDVGLGPVEAAEAAAKSESEGP